jgi:cation transport ATPase
MTHQTWRVHGDVASIGVTRWRRGEEAGLRPAIFLDKKKRTKKKYKRKRKKEKRKKKKEKRKKKKEKRKKKKEKRKKKKEKRKKKKEKRKKKKEKTQWTWWRHVVGGGSCEVVLMGHHVVAWPGNVATAVGLHSLHWGSLVVTWVRWGCTVW